MSENLYPEALRRRIEKISWPQFRQLIGLLGMAEGEFSKDEVTSQRLLRFDDQFIASNLTANEVEEKLDYVTLPGRKADTTDTSPQPTTGINIVQPVPIPELKTPAETCRFNCPWNANKIDSLLISLNRITSRSS